MISGHRGIILSSSFLYSSIHLLVLMIVLGLLSQWVPIQYAVSTRPALSSPYERHWSCYLLSGCQPLTHGAVKGRLSVH